MNRQTKKEIRRLAVKILVAVLALGLAFWGYAFVYRGKTEPPAKYPVTNQDAAVYSLRGQIQMLSQQEELNTFAFEGRKKEKEYGTYIIPGLRYTRTFLNAEGTKQAVCTSMTPQGLAVTDEYVLVSAYCHTEKHNSVIYVINKETHRFIKEVVLPGLPHVGGLAYDQEHDMLWYSSNTNGIAQAISIKMDVLRDYNYADNHMPVQVNQTCSLYGIVRDSFMTFYKGCLYVGCFNKYTESTIARYAVDSKGDLVNTFNEELGMMFEMAGPLDYSTISEQAQGMAFYNDKLLLSHSFGILPSRIVFYEQSDKRLYVNENSARSYRMPEMIEQIVVEGDELYVLFESGAYAYRGYAGNVVDRVLKLNLIKMEESYQEEY